MKMPFDNTYPVTQEFGNKLILDGVDVYGKWEMKGHNGMDFGVPFGTVLKTPISGMVKEANFDQYGYGWYVKIENETEGCVLAHMDKITVKIGYLLQEGDEIGLSGNTGNSTGAHLHWGYYKMPRNRANGFDGYIDQRPLLESLHLLQPLAVSTPVSNDSKGLPSPTPTCPIISDLQAEPQENPQKESRGEVCVNSAEKTSGENSGNIPVKLKTIEETYSEEQYKAAMEDRAKFWKERDEALKQLEELKITTTLEIENLKQALRDSEVTIKDLQNRPAVVTQTLTDSKQEEMIDRLRQENNELGNTNIELQKKLDITLTDYQAYKDAVAKEESQEAISDDEKDQLILSLNEKVKGLVTELTQVLDRNKTLGELISKKEQEDYTAITIYKQKFEELQLAIMEKNTPAIFRLVSDLLTMIRNLFFALRAKPIKPTTEYKITSKPTVKYVIEEEKPKDEIMNVLGF